MALERYFKSVTKDNDQEHSVEIRRIDDSFEVHVSGNFAGHAFDRSYAVSGNDAESKVQEWLYQLDQEVQEMMKDDVPVSLN